MAWELAVVASKVDLGPFARPQGDDAGARPAREWVGVQRFDTAGNAVSQTWAAMERPGAEGGAGRAAGRRGGAG